MNDDNVLELSAPVSKRRQRTITVILVVAALLLAARGVQLIFAYRAEKEAELPRSEEAPVAVRSLTLESQERALTAEATGFLESPATLKLAAETAGRLVRKAVIEGASVAENDVVAVVDDALYRTRVAAARARLAASRAQLEFARKMLASAENLVRDESIGKLELDEWRSKASALEASIEAETAVLAEAELMHEKCQVRAPRAGVWYEDLSREGEYLQPGAPIGLLRQLDPLELRVEVPGHIRLALRLNQQVEIELLDVDSTVHAVESTRRCAIRELPAGSSADSRRFPIVIEVPNSDGALFPGLFARVRIELPRKESLLLIPKECVFRHFGQTSVYVVEDTETRKDFQAALRVVRVRELEDVPASWLIEAGVSAGDRVVLSPIEQLVPGARIAPAPARGGDDKR